MNEVVSVGERDIDIRYVEGRMKSEWKGKRECQ